MHVHENVLEAKRRLADTPRDTAMYYRLLPISVLGLLLAPARVHAQTEEIQREVERTLWYARLWQSIEDATGVPPLIALLTLLALALSVAAAIWLWSRHRKRVD
jgi:hypothetical protein